MGGLKVYPQLQHIFWEKCAKIRIFLNFLRLGPVGFSKSEEKNSNFNRHRPIFFHKSSLGKQVKYDELILFSTFKYFLLRMRESYKRFLSWIQFVGLFLKDSFRGFVSWKQKSQITRFVSFRKDSYTNPASLLFTQNSSLISRVYTM